MKLKIWTNNKTRHGFGEKSQKLEVYSDKN